MNHQTLTVPQVIPQVAYQPPQAHTQLMTESPFGDLGFAVLVFSPGEDPIACLNKAMAFLTAVASSRFPTTNNQLKTSSNLRNQATIQDDRVTVQQVQGRQGRNYSGTTYKGNATSLRGNITSGQARVDAIDFLQIQEFRQIKLKQSSLTMLLSRLSISIRMIQTVMISRLHKRFLWPTFPTMALTLSQRFDSTVMDFTDNEISSDSNIIPYSQYFQETQHETVQDTNLQAQQDSMILPVIEQIETCTKKIFDSLEQNLSKQIKEKESLFKTFSIFKNESKEKENKYLENEIDLEKKIKELDNIICKVGQSAQTVHMLTKPQAFYDNTHKQALGYQNPFYLRKAQRMKPTLYDGVVLSNTHVSMPVIDDEETLIF
ncbi:hypothetical protein Tco_1546008 [Tanacetum coccineum]